MNVSDPLNATDTPYGGGGSYDYYYDGSPGLIDDETTRWLLPLMFGTMMVISPLGVASNVITIATFVKQGFQERINVTFVSLALTDLMSLLALVGTSVCNIWQIVGSGVNNELAILDWHFLTFIREWFFLISALITVYVSVERCFIVIKPFAARAFFTKTKTIVINVMIYLCVSAIYMRHLVYFGFVWEKGDLSAAGIVSFEDIYITDTISAVLVGFAQISVTVATGVLVHGLRAASKFRQKVTTDEGQSFQKDKTIAKMVQVVAIMFILCNIPAIVLVFVIYSLPMLYPKLTMIVYTIARITGGINSSVNIFIYYVLSSKFKSSLKAMFWSR